MTSLSKMPIPHANIPIYPKSGARAPGPRYGGLGSGNRATAMPWTPHDAWANRGRSMIVGLPKETRQGETRVALVPKVIPALRNAGIEVVMEAGAGSSAGYPDDVYREKGVEVLGGLAEVLGKAELLVTVRADRAPEGVRKEQAVLGFADPLSRPEVAQAYASRGLTLISMELIPRITRAQSMDALSSMATVAGYKAVLTASVELPKMFPMMMTAAGTISPARVFVIGAGVAGLQACATAKRLGAVVEAYDVRPAVKEQVESVGAKFVELAVKTGEAEDAGGYAKALGEAFYERQRALMKDVVTASDVVITTAAIPGKRSPVLVTKDMVEGMAPGSVIVDLAAERGGNCELTRVDERVEVEGVTILGPSNITATVPFHASQMYAKNVATLLAHLANDGKLTLDLEDEITQGVVVSHGGEVIHPRVKPLLEAQNAPADDNAASEGVG